MLTLPPAISRGRLAAFRPGELAQNQHNQPRQNSKTMEYKGKSPTPSPLDGIDVFHLLDRLDERGQVLGIVHRYIEAADGPLVPGGHDHGTADVYVPAR